MNFIGVLQTEDINEALAVADKYMAEGRHIITKRVDFSLNPQVERDFMERFPEQYPNAMNEHFTVEYEVSVGIREWTDCDRTNVCPVIIDDLESNKYPYMCDRCQYFNEEKVK